ncbi:MAG: cysteine desulfurase [Clostridia bacterium]|nr:cysteine desulfurase [Clostridia bacterium]
MSNIYLDNSATTKPCDEAIHAMVEAMSENYGNPSSLHMAGTRAAELLLSSRNTVLAALWGTYVRSKLPRKPMMRGGEEYGRLIFTASGTESNNLAIFGAVESCKINAPEIITTDSEHPAVLRAVEKLQEKGVKVFKLKTLGGRIDIDELKSLLSPKTALVSVMYVNNETGAIYDVAEIFKTVKSISPNAVCHTDCVQAFQKLPFTPKTLNADMITVSAHKVHGPKGVGALWVSRELINKNRPFPIIFGGGQESSFRSGTENIPGIAAFAAATEANGGAKAYEEFGRKTEALKRLLIQSLPDGVSVNTPLGNSAPYIISLALPLPKSQPMLNYLSALGIYVSSGSACSSHKNTVSHVLTAFGISNAVADGTIRVSLDISNTEEEILTFCDALSQGITKLAK